MSFRAETAVVILNHNGRTFLKECLDSVFAQDNGDFFVVLVDNASSDGSVDFVRSEYVEKEKSGRLKIVAEDVNQGFSCGNNIGIREALKDETVKYVITLNNDTVLEGGFIRELVQCAERHPDAGSIMSKMVCYSDPGLIDSAGILYSRNTLPFARGKFEPADNYNTEEEIFGACAGACLYRVEALKDVAADGEFFDEYFFAYCEDVDLSFRLRWASWPCYYCPQAVVRHHGGGTKGETSSFVIYHSLRNNSLVMFKNLTRGFILRNLFWIVISEILQPVFNLIFRRKMIVLKAKFDALGRFRAMRAKACGMKRSVNFGSIEKFFVMKWVVSRSALNGS